MNPDKLLSPVSAMLYGVSFTYEPKTGKLYREGKLVEGKNAAGQPRCRVGGFDVTVARIAFELMGYYVDKETRIIHVDGDSTNTRWLNMYASDGLTKYREATPAGKGWNNPNNPGGWYVAR